MVIKFELDSCPQITIAKRARNLNLHSTYIYTQRIAKRQRIKCQRIWVELQDINSHTARASHWPMMNDLCVCVCIKCKCYVNCLCSQHPSMLPHWLITKLHCNCCTHTYIQPGECSQSPSLLLAMMININCKFARMYYYVILNSFKCAPVLFPFTSHMYTGRPGEL